MRRHLRNLALAALLLAAPALAQDPAVALYAEAQALIERAEAAESPAMALLLLERARANLGAILEQHNQSPVAARLVLGDPLERRIDTALAAAREGAEREQAAGGVRREACLAAPDTDCLIELALALAHESMDKRQAEWLRSQVAIVQAETAQFEAAQTTAVGIDDAWFRARALEEIAVALAKAGRADDAREVFDAARNAVSIVNDGNRAFQLKQIAVTQTTVGQRAEGLAAARRIDNEYYRYYALREIAVLTAEAGQRDAAKAILADAEAIARGTGDASTRFEMLADAAVAMAEIGEIEAALAAARRLGVNWAGMRALSGIAKVQLEMGDPNGAEDSLYNALASARQMRDPTSRGSAMAALGPALAAIGRIEEAREAFDFAVTTAGNSWASLQIIARSQAEAGLFTSALATVSRIGDISYRGSALEAIVVGQINAGNTESALATARNIEQASLRDATMGAVARALSAAGNIEAALFAYGEIKAPMVRANVLGEIAAAQARARLLEDAVATTRKIDDSQSLARTYLAIAQGLAER